MPLTLVQFGLPFTGPWGTRMTQALSGLAQDIAQEPGLVWTVWTKNKAESRPAASVFSTVRPGLGPLASPASSPIGSSCRIGSGFGQTQGLPGNRRTTTSTV